MRVVGGEITKVPWLKLELEKYLLKTINELMLWPRRLVLPAEGLPSDCVLSRAQAGLGLTLSLTLSLTRTRARTRTLTLTLTLTLTQSLTLTLTSWRRC